MATQRINRRSFLQTSAAVGAARYTMTQILTFLLLLLPLPLAVAERPNSNLNATFSNRCKHVQTDSSYVSIIAAIQYDLCQA